MGMSVGLCVIVRDPVWVDGAFLKCFMFNLAGTNWCACDSKCEFTCAYGCSDTETVSV